nr:FMN-binding glutamate synthase family protein [Candidatus Njordarchaeota archaeon]
MRWVGETRKRALSGRLLVSGGRSNKLNVIGFDDLVFVPAQLARAPVDYYRENVSAETMIGGSSENPLRLKTPILISAMSFGALSKEAKIALAKASSMAGTSTNTGEGGMLPEERKEAELLIAQYSTGRFGVDEEYIRKADAIEIKIGQGAKPGSGGLLPGVKVTEEIARLRRVPVGEDVHSPARHPDIEKVEDLKKKVGWIRDLNGGKPVIIKLGAGEVENDIKFAVKAGPDAIAVDGMEAGTGAAPKIMLDDFGIPALAALVKARKVLDKLKAKQELLIGGGLNKGGDVAKALALGADAVFMGFPMLVAMGCTYCQQCHLGRCPVGIATQDPNLRKKLDLKAARKVYNFITACTEEVKMAAAACGKRDVHELSRADLRSISLVVSKITGVPLVGN